MRWVLRAWPTMPACTIGTVPRTRPPQEGRASGMSGASAAPRPPCPHRMRCTSRLVPLRPVHDDSSSATRARSARRRCSAASCRSSAGHAPYPAARSTSTQMPEPDDGDPFARRTPRPGRSCGARRTAAVRSAGRLAWRSAGERVEPGTGLPPPPAMSVAQDVAGLPPGRGWAPRRASRGCAGSSATMRCVA